MKLDKRFKMIKKEEHKKFWITEYQQTLEETQTGVQSHTLNGQCFEIRHPKQKQTQKVRQFVLFLLLLRHFFKKKIYRDIFL